MTQRAMLPGSLLPMVLIGPIIDCSILQCLPSCTDISTSLPFERPQHALYPCALECRKDWEIGLLSCG